MAKFTMPLQVDGIIEPKKIRSIRKALGLNQKDAGELFGGGHNAFSRYERGELAPPKALSMLLDLLDSHEERLPTEAFFYMHFNVKQDLPSSPYLLPQKA